VTNLAELLNSNEIVEQQSAPDKIILEGQYLEAYEAMQDAANAGLYVGLIGPVGSGKTALCRQFAHDLGRPFDWVTFSDLVRPSNLIGSFDPTLVFKFGYDVQSFSPGPFTISALQGGVFLANELNRGDEYVLNSLLDALEEQRLYIPSLKKWYAVDDDFYLIAAMNPAEMRGARRLPAAIKDRIKVWIELGYPKKAIEHQIVTKHCGEYSLSPSHIEMILELVSQTREDPSVETPASIRSSIGMARLAAERAKRLGVELDNRVLAQAARLTMSEAIRMKPGRNVDEFLSRIVKRILGVDFS